MKKFIYLLFCFVWIQSSAQYANGKIKIYFNRPVDHAVAGNYNAVFLNQTLADTLAAYINRAKYSVDVAQYDYLSYAAVANIATAINSAYSRGVTVRWIYNGSSPNSALTSLNSGIKTLASPTTSAYGIMHDKFVIIDANSANTSDPIVWTGSADWSQEQIDSDVNNIIIFQDQPLAQAYTAEFNQMWGSTTATPNTTTSKFGPYKTDLGPHTFTIGGSTVELYFSPKDSTNNHILTTINSANSQLFFGVYTFTSTADANAIVARKNAGVYTAGIIDQYSSSYSAAPILSAGLGSMLKTYTQSTSIYHSKFLVVDPCNTSSDPMVLTGSHNWTSSADTKNDENTVIIHNADVANIYYQAFFQNFLDLGGSMTACTVTNSCANAVSATVQLNSNVLCNGQSNGNATVHAHGSHGPFTYHWSSTPAQTDSVLDNVSAGSYTVTVLDANSCSITASVTITQPLALGVSVTETNLTCNGAGNGTASAAATGGTGAYQYKWSSSPQQTTATAGNLPAGTYHVTVTDANSCSVTSSATITQPTSISVTGIITNVACLNGNTGKVVASASGGTSGYQYLWNTTPQQNTATANNLTAGSYTVTVTDAHNCTGSATFSVTQPASGITLSVAENDAACGSNNGSATVNVLTGTGSFTYAWSNGGTAATISNLAAGSYSITVSNTAGCTATSATLVNSTGGPTVVPGSTNTSCGLNNGAANIVVSGGVTPYSYSWSNGGTATSISNLSAGTYVVTVHDHNNCASIASVVISASNGLVLNTSSSPTSCGINNGSATVTVGNAGSPLFAWNNGATTATINNLAAGNYTVTVSDAGLCSASASVTVASGTGVTGFNIIADKTIVCFGDSAHLCAVSGYTNYVWSNAAGSVCTDVSQSGNYSVTASDNGGCSATSTPVLITVNPAFQITFGTTGDTLIATSATAYQWLLNGTPISGATTGVWIATQSGNYSVEGTDANGCVGNSHQTYITITGIHDYGSADLVKVYPNPSSGSWNLEVNSEWLGGGLEIFDTNGKLVYQSEIKSLKSDLAPDIEQGMYLLRITANGHGMIRKLVKL